MADADRIARLLRRRRRRPGPLRSVHVCSTAEGAFWMVQIASGLRDRGWDVSCVIGGAGGSTARHCETAGIPFVVDTHMALRLDPWLARVARVLRPVPGIGRRAAGVARGASLVRQALPLARKLRDLEADVVQSYVSSSIFVARIAAVLAGAPVRVSMPTGPLQLEWSLLRACDLRTLWLEQRVITGSGYTADLYRSYGVAEEKIASIPFGADPALFDRAREDTAAVRSELGVDADTPLVGNVAYFYGVVPEILGETFDFAYDRERGLKGQEDFVDAAKIVHDVRPDVRFVLVGGAWGAAGEKQLARVRQQVRELGLEGVVLFTGARPRVTDMLAALDVSVQCPVSDNYGGTFESLLMEAPTIGTAAGPIPEVIRHEQTGLLVPPADPEALAAAMLRLIEDPALARKLAAAGRQLVLDAFTTEQTVDRIDAVYRELAQRAGLDAPPLR